MKPIVEKILKAGLVDKHTAALMERWGQLDRGASEIVGTASMKDASLEEFEKFAEGIGELLEKEQNEFRETRLDIQVQRTVLLRLEIGPGDSKYYSAVVDELGHLIVNTKDTRLIPGEFLEIEDEDQQKRERVRIDYVQWLYKGEEPYAAQLTMNEKAQLLQF